MHYRKVFATIIPVFVFGIAGYPQAMRTISTKAVQLNTSRTTKLSWYSKALQNTLSNPPGSSSAAVLGSQSYGSNRVEIGVGLTGSESGFRPEGSSKQTQKANSVCTVQPMKIDFVTGQQFNLFTSSLNIYPGEFFNINSIVTNSFSQFQSPPRKPYQLGMNIFNPANPAPNMLNVTDVSRSPLPDIQTVLLAPNYGASIPAAGIIDVVRINSEYELQAQLNTSQGVFLPLAEFGIPLDITSGLKGEAAVETGLNLKYYMVHFIQPMYQISVLTHNNELFQTTGAHTSCANGAYISSITYGRRAMIIIGSLETEQRVTAAISAALSASVTATEAAGLEVGNAVSGETDISLRNIAQKFHANIYGGSSAPANQVFSDIADFRQAFRTYVTSASASRFGPSTGALPLHYTLRRISDNSVLAVRSVGSFEDLISCNTSKYRVEVLWKGFRVNSVLEAPFDDKEDIYGTLKLGSVSANGSTQQKNLTIKDIPMSGAISKGAGQTDEDDIAVLAMTDVDKSTLQSSILNFSQGFFDVDLATRPAYKENNSGDLKFNFSNVISQIDALQPGQSRVIDHPISLTETSAIGSSRITLLTKIRISRN